MSSDFRLHYDRLRENDPTTPKPQNPAGEAGAFYDAPGHARNLCLIWTEGKQQFLSYAYLVGGEFLSNSEINVIVLDFSAYLVTLKGFALSNLFAALTEQRVKFIVQSDTRYLQKADESSSEVVEIIVKSKNE